MCDVLKDFFFFFFKNQCCPSGVRRGRELGTPRTYSFAFSVGWGGRLPFLQASEWIVDAQSAGLLACRGGFRFHCVNAFPHSAFPHSAGAVTQPHSVPPPPLPTVSCSAEPPLLPGGSVVKNPPVNAGDTGSFGSIPGSGRSPWKRE